MSQTSFFETIRSELFSGTLTLDQRTGMEIILARWRALVPHADRRWIAYGLATAHHETGRLMQPVRETFAGSSAQAICRLERAYRRGRLPQVSTPYWRVDAQGKSWFGRGYVQLTHRDNYATLAMATGLALLDDPDLALQTEAAATILVVGLVEGLFGGHRIAEFFRAGTADWAGARRTVNGTDRADLVAGYARHYDAALASAGF
ncbi:glycoside hydrolase family 19 protein [Xaviernesmea oryzae]|uniref:glycoside hydrolase family 19 protein n=1 Tax=Xaviernesmea oryzae TaxID=464029 RepID=UPI0008B3BB75|nr:glycoside hydrolase family 19 protein [Xaviernesmea oryzae]SEL75562.1 Chitinase class I [Xaviernesmea oryzae]